MHPKTLHSAPVNHGISDEEKKLLSRSNKKVKRDEERSGGGIQGDNQEEFPTLSLAIQGNMNDKKSFAHMVVGSSGDGGRVHLNELFWEGDGRMGDMEDDPPMPEVDPKCPVILLSAEDKRRIREPWRDAIIIKECGVYDLRNTLSKKWKLKGEFSMIDVGNDYYVVLFRHVEDLSFVMLSGP
ncbi:hypothetical protein V2J09_001219 [Rumex salicifolius]